MLERVYEVDCVESPLFESVDIGGNQCEDYVLCVVVKTDADVECTHFMSYGRQERDKIELLMNRIKQRGFIDPQYWNPGNPSNRHIRK